jgi:molybdopterin molybdotransferase
MLSVEQALERLLANVPSPPESELVKLLDARNRVLTGDIKAKINVPPADNSAMDGYAIRHQDWVNPEQHFDISQRIAAGHPPKTLTEGTAARIFTGAEIPDGADTVIMQENCVADESVVSIGTLPEKGSNIRDCGQDLKVGQQMLPSGQRLRAQDLGLMASQGMDEVSVGKRLRVAVMSNGDELVEPGQQTKPGQIYNSNRYTVSALLDSWGFEVVDFGIAADNPQAIKKQIGDAAEQSDVIISSGGVSVGEEDHVKGVVESLGSLDLWKIAIRPGKPFAFGQVGTTPFLGLPGNPVSVFVTLLIIGRPYLFACQRMNQSAPVFSRQLAVFDKKAGSREDYIRVRSTETGLESYVTQSSGVLMSTCWGDGLVRQRVGQEIRAGDQVDFLPYTSLY